MCVSVATIVWNICKICMANYEKNNLLSVHILVKKEDITLQLVGMAIRYKCKEKLIILQLIGIIVIKKG